jgi:hypothetical protein
MIATIDTTGAKPEAFSPGWWNVRMRDRQGLLSPEWIRWRLADEIDSRFWVSHAVRVLPVYFEPMDGDLYSHPVVRTDCTLGKASFGRLSRHRIALDDLPYEKSFRWAGLTGKGAELRYEDAYQGDWDAFATAAVGAMGLDRLPDADHSGCGHPTGFMLPHVHRLALLLRTRLGRQVHSGRWLGERTLDYTGLINLDIAELKRQMPAARSALVHGQWIAVTEGRYEPQSPGLVALTHSGTAFSRAGQEDIGQAFLTGQSITDVAIRLDAALNDYRLGGTPAR